MIATIFGKFGDILWALPAARELAKQHGPLDFWVGRDFTSILPLLEFQPYIASAEALPEWTTHQAPPPRPCSGEVVHLGHTIYVDMKYPHPDAALVDILVFGAGLAGWERTPFLTAPERPQPARPLVTVGFGENYRSEVEGMVAAVQQAVQETADVVDLRTLPWLDAASALKAATVHFGNRSALNVLAHGIGKPVVAYERYDGARVPTYSYPYGDETLTSTVEEALVVIRERIIS